MTFKAQLCTSTADPAPFIESDVWACEPKWDGVRCLTLITPTDIRFLNRKGGPLTKRIPLDVITTATELSESGFRRVVLDGEIVDDDYVVFDAPFIEPLKGQPLVTPSTQFSLRRCALELVLAGFPIQFTVQEQSNTGKQCLFDSIYAQGGEGVVFKSLYAPYHPGKATRYCVKYKFTKELECFVRKVGVGGKQNAELAVFSDNQELFVGRVSTVNHPLEPNDVVTVRYLNLSPHGRLVNPRIIRVRTDKTPSECTLDQLI